MAAHGLVSIEHHPNGPRVRVAHQRVHHGATGCLLAAVGVVLAWSDRHDWRDWFRKGSQ